MNELTDKKTDIRILKIRKYLFVKMKKRRWYQKEEVEFIIL